MKTFIKYFKYTVLGLWFLPLTYSCSDDFLKDSVFYYWPSYDGIHNNEIYISPAWGAADYPIYCPEAGNARFSLSDIPAWLNVSSKTGQFVNGDAYITCSAVSNGDFAESGFYSAYMTIDIEGLGKYTILVYYVNEGTPEIKVSGNLELNYNNYYYGEYVLNIANKGEGILIWEVTAHPEWITLDFGQSTNILPSHEVTSVNVAYNSNYLITEKTFDGTVTDKLTGQIIIASNDKNSEKTAIDVSFRLGAPDVNFYTDEIDFGRTETDKTFSFSVWNGFLIWRIEDCPEWITFSQTHGVTQSYADLQVTCNRSKLPAGANFATVTVRTNDPNNPLWEITLKCRNGSVNSENVKAISGTVTDAWFDKTTDMLYLSTKQPNHLLVYDTKTKTTANEITLTNAPACFSVSEDRQKIAVGHEGKISFIDMNSLAVEKTVEIETTVSDIEWGVDDWCCYVPGTTFQQFCSLKWINTVSDERYESSDDSDLYGGAIIRKIPNQDYIVATRLQLSPSGLIVYNFKTRQFVNYFHESFDRLWVSADGTYLFDAFRNVYRTSTLQAENISPVAQLKLDNQVRWIDHNPATGSLWVLRQDWYNALEPKVWQLEPNDYTVVNTFYHDDYYLTTVNGVQAEYPVEAHYVFANSADTEIVVIKNVEQGNAWSLEYIAVNTQ
jgi:hypothetical protein